MRIYIRITSCWIHAPGRLCALVVFKKLSRVEFKKIYIKDPTLLQLSESFFFKIDPESISHSNGQSRERKQVKSTLVSFLCVQQCVWCIGKVERFLLHDAIHHIRNSRRLSLIFRFTCLTKRKSLLRSESYCNKKKRELHTELLWMLLFNAFFDDMFWNESIKIEYLQRKLFVRFTISSQMQLLNEISIKNRLDEHRTRVPMENAQLRAAVRFCIKYEKRHLTRLFFFSCYLFENSIVCTQSSYGVVCIIPRPFRKRHPAILFITSFAYKFCSTTTNDYLQTFLLSVYYLHV